MQLDTLVNADLCRRSRLFVSLILHRGCNFEASSMFLFCVQVSKLSGSLNFNLEQILVLGWKLELFLSELNWTHGISIAYKTNHHAQGNIPQLIGLFGSFPS